MKMAKTILIIGRRQLHRQYWRVDSHDRMVVSGHQQLVWEVTYSAYNPRLEARGLREARGLTGLVDRAIDLQNVEK